MCAFTGKKDTIVLDGILLKKSRGRALIVVTNWSLRKTFLHSNKLISYWEGDVLKGKISLEGAQTRLIPPSEADGKSHVFEVQNTHGEIMLFSTDSDQTTETWRNAIQAVVYDTVNGVKSSSETAVDECSPADTGKEEEA